MNLGSEQKNREAKVRKVVAFVLNEQAKMFEKPENTALMVNAAMAAGVNEPSAESKVMICAMLRGIAVGVKEVV